MDDATIRLILDMGASAASVDQVREKLQALQAATQQAGDAYEVLDARTGTYAISTHQVDAATEKAVQAAVAQTHAQRALNQVLEESAAKGKAAAGVSRDMQMRILNLGRATQDLAQGGFGAILNNIEGLVGGSGVLAGALTLLGTAVLVTKPYWEGWLKQLGEVKEKIPESADAVESLTAALKRDRHALEEMRKQGELNYWDMEKYQQLVRRTADEERSLAEERMAHSVGAAQSKAHRERAGAFREQLAEFGGSDKLLEVLQLAGLKEGEAKSLHNDAIRGIQGSAERIRDLTRQMPESSQFRYHSPAEDRALADLNKEIERVTAQEEKEKAAAAKKREKEERALADLNKEIERVTAQEEKAEARAIQEDVKLGRAVGKAWAKPGRPEKLDKLPMLRADATAGELDQAMLENQAQMTANLAALQQQLHAARRIGRENRELSRERRQPQVDPGVF